MHELFTYLRSAGCAGLLLLLTSLLAPQHARATHAMGTDMSYVNVGPGMYFVQFRFYRDCGGITASATFDLAYQATGCGVNGTGTNAGGSIALTRRASQIGNPYCPQVNALSPCDSSSIVVGGAYPNHEIITYGGVVSLGTGPDALCSDWVLSTELTSRPNSRNLGFGGDLYSEAHLNTRLVQDESSPAFSIFGGLQPLIVMYENTPVRYNGGVVDPDGDSLAYAMQRPLTGPNTPATYANGHSLQDPIRLMTGSAPLQIDQQGTLSFTPGAVVGNSIDDEANKFVLVIQVEAWRRINGVRHKVSTVRREVATRIATALAPNPAPVISAHDSSIAVIYPTSVQYVPYGDTIYSYAGEPLEINIPIRDTNGDSIFVEMPASLAPTASSLAGPFYDALTPAETQAHVRIFWTPTATDVRSQAHTFYLRVRDNGCPNASSAFYPLSVLVAAQRPLGLVADANPRLTLHAAPNPFNSTTRLTAAANSAGTPAQVSIYDLTGRLVDQLTISPAGTAEWHAPAALPAGTYVARCIGPGGPQTVRLLKQ